MAGNRYDQKMEEIRKMNVNGIGAGYPIVGYETRRTERNVAGRNFAEQAADAAQATATLHGAEEGSGDIAISSWADVVSGSSISVYKTQDFDAANPVYKVKTWDKSGNVTEQMVDVSKIVIISRQGIRSGTLFRSTESLLRTNGSPLGSARQHVISCF